MKDRRFVWAIGWALMLLIVPPPAAETADNAPRHDGRVTPDAIPEIRRIFVPAASPEHWPKGSWQEMRLGELERIESQLNTLRRADPQVGSAPLERAEYQATFVGESLQQGRLEWTPRQSAIADDFLPLEPLNLAVGQLEWMDNRKRHSGRPVVWGTAPSHSVGLVRERDGETVTGNWALRGRRLVRSTEFDLRLPRAMVSNVVLQVPDGLQVTSTAGDLAGPKAAAESGWSLWQLHLGSRSACRLRFSPPVSAAARRPLVLTRSRTNYVVRPEVVRLVAEFDLEVYEAAATELHLALDAGLQVTAAEYGDEDEVEWRILDGSDGREIVVVLPDALSGPGQTLRIHGIAPLKPQEPWKIPRMRLKDAVDPEPQVKVRLHPPFQAADVRIDGFRQVELTNGPTDGETLLLRQLRTGASLTIIPAHQLLAGVCRSVTLLSLDGDEWTLTTSLDLKATSGEVFDVTCDFPSEWEITSAQGENDPGPSDLSGWFVESIAGKSSRLHLSFLTALGPSRPQRVRIAARRQGVPSGEALAVFAPTSRELADLEAVTVFVGSEKRRPIVDRLSGFEELNLADLPPEVQNLEFLKSLPVAARAMAVVVRTDMAVASGTIVVRPLFGSEDPGAARGKVALERIPETRRHASTEPLVAISVDVEVKLSAAEAGFDLYRVIAVFSGPTDAELSWRLPEIVEPIAVRMNDHSAAPRIVDGRQTLLLSEPASKPGDGHILSLEYRTPVQRRFGPNRQQLALPDFTPAVMNSRLTVLIPRTLQIVERPAGMDVTDLAGESDSLLGPLGRKAAAPFHPFRGADWAQLVTVLAPWHDDGQSEDLTTPSAVEFHNPAESLSNADFEILQGGNLSLPGSVELVVWDRRQAESLTWAACLTSLLGTVCLRIRGVARGRIVAALLAAGLTGALCVFPRFSGEFVGSILVGLIIGILLPERCCRFPRAAPLDDFPSVPSGSTRAFVASSALLVWSALTFACAISAQESRSAPGGSPGQSATRRAQERLDVLIPTAGGRSEDVRSICYVPAGFRARMDRLLSIRHIPSYLLNSVAVKAEVTKGGQTDVTAKFKVYVLSADNPVTIELPVTNVVLGGQNACLVDGRPHPILLGPDGRNLTIELSRKSDRPPAVPEPDIEPSAADAIDNAADSTPGARPAAERLPAAAFQIQLQLHLATDLEANDSFRSRLGIPRANDTSVEFSAGGGLVPLLTIAADDGIPQVIGAGPSAPERIAGWTGPTGQLDFRWSRNAQGVQALPVELDATVAGMVDVSSPGLASTTYRIGYRVLSGSVDSLVWKLPRGCALQSVHSPGLSGYVIEPGEEDSRLLFLEFAAPQSGSLAVTATVIQPLPTDARECEFPLLEPDGAFVYSAHTILRRYQMAFRPPVDFRLEVSAPSNLVIKPRNVDDFLKDWPIVGARPQQALELIRAGTLGLKFRDLESELTARTESQGRFTSNRLEWSFRAEIDPAIVPPFQYRLQIDPRLRIRDVSVQEDGAERLLRWSRVDDTLILFLSDRAARTQSLRVSALMPLSTPEDLELPQLTLSGTKSSSQRVALRCEPDVRVTIAGDASGRVPLDLPVDALEQDSKDRLVAQFDVPAGNPLPPVRVEPSPAVASAVAAYLLRPSGTGQELTVAVQFRVVSGRVRQFDLELPADLAGRARIETIPPSQPLQLPASDDRSHLVFAPSRPVSDRFYVVIRAPVEIPADADWAVPAVTSSDFQASSEYLLVGGEELPDFPSVEPPDWLHGLFENEPDFAPLVCYRLPADRSSPTIRLKSGPGDSFPDLLFDASVELDRGGVLYGQLRLWLPDRAGTELVMDWPAGCEPLAVFVDDEPERVPAPARETWTLPLPTAASPRLVWLAWKEQHAGVPGLAGRWRPRIPAPQNIAVKTELLTIRTAPRFIIRPREAEGREGLLEAALARWQAVLSAAGRRSASEEPWLVNTLAETVHAAESLAARHGTEIPIPLRQHLEGLRRQSERLKLPKATDNPMAAAFARSLANTDRNKAATAGTSSGQTWTRSDSQEVSGGVPGSGDWLINRPAVDALLGILAALVVGLIVWTGARAWSWFQHQEPLAWTALGTFWWLALRPSALGLALVAWGAIKVVQILKARRAEAAAPAASI